MLRGLSNASWCSVLVGARISQSIGMSKKTSSRTRSTAQIVQPETEARRLRVELEDG
jgi:hypothetical protein